jgi:hypothetical protein
LIRLSDKTDKVAAASSIGKDGSEAVEEKTKKN